MLSVSRFTLSIGIIHVLGCATAASSAPPPKASERSQPEQGCKVTVFADKDVTVVAIDLPQLGVAGAALPGTGWETTCATEGNRDFQAEHAATGRMATITIDTGIRGDVDLPSYAQQQIQWVVDGAKQAHGTELEAGAPQIVADGVYGFAVRGTHGGGLFLQFNAHHVVPTKQGLLRYHLSETGSDPAVLNGHTSTLLNAVNAFGLPPN